MKTLTDGIFETGAYGVPSKSQNPTILGQGGPSIVPNIHILAGQVVGAICLAPTATLHFGTVHKTKYLVSHWKPSKISLEITNVWCGDNVKLSEHEWRCQNG